MNDEKKCKIWGTEAEVKYFPSQCNGDGAYDVNSPRAGGKYWIAALAVSELGNKDEQLKIKLTNWILKQNRLGGTPKVNFEEVQRAGFGPSMSVFDRADGLLRYLNHKTKHLGDVTSLYYPGVEENKDKQFIHELLAWTGSEKLQEIITLIEYCHEQRWLGAQIKNEGLPPNVKYEIKLRPPGYVRLNELDGVNTESAQCFVAMWLDDRTKDAYDSGIKIAIEDSGYDPLRIDQKQHVNKIDDEIIAEIRRSRFVVADFTSEPDKPRGGVYYEAGFAQGLNIPVIWTCKKQR